MNHSSIVRAIREFFRDNPPVKYGTDVPLYRPSTKRVLDDARMREQQSRGGGRSSSRNE